MRPRVSPAAGFLAGCGAFFGLIALGCVGMTAFTTRTVLSRVEEEQVHRLEALDQREAQLAEAEALLDEVAEWLRAARSRERRYPRALREQPPADPWGNPLLYTNSGLDRAELRSAGPDGVLDSMDDLVRTLGPR